MKGLLVVAGLAAAVAAVSGVLLVSAPREGGAGSPSMAGPGAPAGRAGERAAPRGDSADPPPDLERRLRALEMRIEELQGQLLMTGAGGGGSWTPGGDGGEDAAAPGAGAAGAPESDGDPGPGEEKEGTGLDGSGSEAVRENLARRTAELKLRTAEVRREAEIRKRLDQMAATMNLQPAEKDRMEEIVRAHVARAEEVGARARDLFRDSPFGLTPGDRATLEQLTADRKVADRETEQAILGLVGADRWKAFRASVKEQAEKERALRRLGQPW